jgi:hypothetical protein
MWGWKRLALPELLVAALAGSERPTVTGFLLLAPPSYEGVEDQRVNDFGGLGGCKAGLESIWLSAKTLYLATWGVGTNEPCFWDDTTT